MGLSSKNSFINISLPSPIPRHDPIDLALSVANYHPEWFIYCESV